MNKSTSLDLRDRNGEPFWYRSDDPSRRTLSVAWRVAKCRAHRRVLHWAALAYRWCIAFRIASGYIRFARNGGRDHCRIGPAVRVLPDQSLLPHERTEARTSGIQTLRARIGAWAAPLDLQIFLVGFDAGEEFVLRMGSTGYIESFLTPVNASGTACAESRVRKAPEAAQVPDEQPRLSSQSGARS